MRSIPTLHLDGYRSPDSLERAKFALALRDGLCTFGFVTLEGHGIAPDLVRRVYDHFERFFALPESSKLACSGAALGQRGFTPLGVEHAKSSAVPDAKEFYHVGQPLPDEAFFAAVGFSSEIAAYPRNVWPHGTESLPRDSVQMFRALEACAMDILRALAESFGLRAEVFSELLRGGNSILRALHYPPLHAELPPGSVRAAAHEDINLITLLCEASGPGLEILACSEIASETASEAGSETGQKHGPAGVREPVWLPVEVAPGQIVVDSGDMLSRITNGVVPATTHRVVNPRAAENRHRYSLPFFAHPRPSCDLSVLNEFVTDGRPRAHPPITAGAFLRERLAEIGLLDGTGTDRG